MRKCSEMPYHTGIELRFYPSRKQKQIVAVNDGCRRVVYNRLIALNNERYQLSKAVSFVPVYQKRIEYIDSILRNPEQSLQSELKNAMPFLYGDMVDSLTIDNAIRNYRAAWKKFREDIHAGVPTFHKKSYKMSYQTNAHYRKDATCINDSNARFLDKSHMLLPILGRVRIRGSMKRISDIINRKDTRIGTITIKKDTIGRYFVSLQLASEQPFVAPLRKTGAMAGIDLNIENFLWDSNNNVIDNPKFRRTEQKRIAAIQKAMCRKREQAKKDHKPLSECKNYQKDRIELARLYCKISGRSDDFRNCLSKDYIENQDYVFAEDMKVRNLLKNHRLALAISECGWSDFLHKLEYKADMYGKTFIKVPPHQTTQTCNHCGHVLKKDEKLSLGDREWVCPECKTYHIRDYNASKNILTRGLTILGM